ISVPIGFSGPNGAAAGVGAQYSQRLENLKEARMAGGGSVKEVQSKAELENIIGDGSSAI
ncbi:hypothetical protein HAX54_019868, partial [Datura stramonium]|nr:hypothetical protein [Datura stramonium]